MAEREVWECNDLRKEIFSYLRKTPKLHCIHCYKVLIWDKKVHDYIMISWIENSPTVPTCVGCWYNNYNGPGCIIT